MHGQSAHPCSACGSHAGFRIVEMSSSQPPLVVDLDGTLVRTDMLHESAIRVVRERPLDLLRLPVWLWRGKAAVKQALAARASFDPATLPYHEAFLAWLREQAREGRRLVLCTASDRTIADAVAGHLNLFDEVLASDGHDNLAGARKAEVLVQRYGEQGFDYAGNSSADLAVWPRARQAVVVAPSPGVLQRARAQFQVEQVFAAAPAGGRTWLRAMRPHQWLKNLLLAVPLLGAHQLGDWQLWALLVLAFVAFSLCASAVYIGNDLLDLDSDRAHPRKRLRPLAAGVIPAWNAVVAAPLLFMLAMLLAWPLGRVFAAWLLAYFVLTSLYSWRLKRLLIIDCLTLAMLYTLRVAAGAAAVHVRLTYWLLVFCGFLFLSLAFVKRYAEMAMRQQQGEQGAAGRAYLVGDAPLLQSLGVASGFCSALVLALYLNSDAVLRLYRTPGLMWGAVPVLAFWVSWMWMQAHRGRMHDDPLVFAVKDKASLAAGVAFAASLALGSLDWTW